MIEMYGKIAVEMDPGDLRELCMQHIPEFSPARYDIVAIRLFAAKENMLTIYVHDKLHQSETLPEGKYPVRKFKKEVQDPMALFHFIKAFNFTIGDGDHDIEGMEVINR